MGIAPAQTRTKTQLIDLRRAAGYRTSKEFAAALGIPATTYSRYENAAGTPDAAIPLRVIWAMADRLGCSIDKVVGREDDTADGERDLNAAYRALSEGGKERFDEYLQFLDFRDRMIATQGR